MIIGQAPDREYRGKQTFGLMLNSDEKHGLVVLLQTMLTYLLHDPLPDLAQGLCRVLRQQLLQAGQSEFLVSIVGYF